MSERRVIDAVALMSVGRIGFSDTFKNLFDTCHCWNRKIEARTNPMWEQTLSELIETGLQANTKYLLFVDGDGIYTEHDVWELHRIIEQDENCDAVFPVQASRFGEQPLVWNWCSKQFGPYHLEQPTSVYPHGHFGLTLIRSDVFRRLPRPWFQSLPGRTGRWTVEDGKMDADTYFWQKLHQLQLREKSNYCLLANCVVIGHMELHVRWQIGADVIVQTLPEYYQYGKPPGTRNPTPMDYENMTKGAKDLLHAVHMGDAKRTRGLLRSMLDCIEMPIRGNDSMETTNEVNIEPVAGPDVSVRGSVQADVLPDVSAGPPS